MPGTGIEPTLARHEHAVLTVTLPKQYCAFAYLDAGRTRTDFGGLRGRGCTLQHRIERNYRI
jgi:hypothetical protein